MTNFPDFDKVKETPVLHLTDINKHSVRITMPRENEFVIKGSIYNHTNYTISGKVYYNPEQDTFFVKPRKDLPSVFDFDIYNANSMEQIFCSVSYGAGTRFETLIRIVFDIVRKAHNNTSFVNESLYVTFYNQIVVQNLHTTGLYKKMEEVRDSIRTAEREMIKLLNDYNRLYIGNPNLLYDENLAG